MGCGLGGSGHAFLELDVLQAGVADKVRCESKTVSLCVLRHAAMKVDSQQERKAKAIIGASFGGNELSQGARNELIRERSLCHGLRKDGVGAGNARTNNEGGQERHLWYDDVDAHAGEDPHDSHDWKETYRHLFPVVLLVSCWKLESSNDQLHANHNSAHSLGELDTSHIFCTLTYQCDGFLLTLSSRAPSLSIDELGCQRSEYDTEYHRRNLG